MSTQNGAQGAMMSDNVLFYGNSLDDVLQARGAELQAFVSQLDPDSVLATPQPDMIDRLIDQFEVECPDLKWEDRYSAGAQDARIDVTGDHLRATFGPGPHYVQATSYSLHIPFTGDRDVFGMKPQTYSLSPPRGAISGSELILTVTMPSDVLGPDAVRRELDTRYGQIANSLASSRAQIHQFNEGLRGTAVNLLTQRREKVLRDRALEVSIGVPVATRADPAPILAVNVPRKRTATSLPASKPFTPEPAITRLDYEAIIGSIAAFGLAAERFPETFGPMHEPILREILLVVLNNQFGVAVGEMFSRKGKTDIAILHSDTPVFIAECKIWEGPSEFVEGIDQLLSYLVWRDSRAAMVLFVKNKNVSAAVSKAMASVQEHAQFKRAAPEAAGQPVFVLHHEGDVSREIELAVISVPIPRTASPDDTAR